MLAALLALASLVVAQSEPDGNLLPFHKVETRALQARQSCNRPGYGTCGSGYCYPLDGAECCGASGTYCPNGQYCVSGGCCPRGEVCIGQAGTWTDYWTTTRTRTNTNTYYNTETYQTTATTTSERPTTTTGTVFAPNPNPIIVTMGAETTKVVSWYEEVTWVGTWYEYESWSCGPGRKGMRCDKPGANATITFGDDVAGFTLAATSYLRELMITIDNVAQPLTLLDFDGGIGNRYQDCDKKYIYKYEFTSVRTVHFSWWGGITNSLGGEDYWVQLNEIVAYKNSADLNTITNTESLRYRPTTAAGGAPGGGLGGAAATGMSVPSSGTTTAAYFSGTANAAGLGNGSSIGLTGNLPSAPATAMGSIASASRPPSGLVVVLLAVVAWALVLV